jgi:hypothetical protein
MSHINPIYILQLYFHKIHINLHLGLSGGLFPSFFPTKVLYAFVFSMRAACSASITVLDFMILTVFGEKYKLRRS